LIGLLAFKPALALRRAESERYFESYPGE